MAKGMKTGTKVMIGVGVLALAGGVGYFLWKRSQGVEDLPYPPPPVPAGSGPLLQQRINLPLQRMQPESQVWNRSGSGVRSTAQFQSGAEGWSRPGSGTRSTSM